MGLESEGLSAEVSQSAAAGLVWRSEGKGDHCGNVAGVPLSNSSTQQRLLILQSFVDRQEFLQVLNKAERVADTLLSRELDVVEQPAVKKGLNGGDGPNIVLVFPSLDEGDESGGVQMLMILWQRWWLCMVQGGVTSVSVHHASGLQPGLLQAGPRRGAPLRLALEQQAHKVPGSSAHTLEVVLREAEVKTTDVQTRLLQTLIQEGRGTAQNNVGHHPC